MDQRLIHLAFAEKSVAQAVVGLGIVGVDLQRSLVVSDRLIHFALFAKSLAEVVVGH